MKIVSRFVLVLAFAAATFGFGNANAQDIQTVSVKFPFPITVGTTTLPAGDYTISNFDRSSDAGVFLVRGTQGKAVAFAATRMSSPVHPLTKDDVVVEVTGDKHVLSQVRLQYSDSVYELIRASK